MNNNIVMSDLRSFLPIPMIIHPFLIALYFVLALYTQNISEASPGVIWRPLILLLLVTASLLVILRSLTGNPQRSALIVSLVLLIFLSYGHVYNFLRNDLNLKDVALGEVYIFRHSFLSVLWIILGILGTFIILRFKKTHALTLFLNSVSIIMLVFPVFDIGLYIYREQVYGSKQNVQATSLNLPDDGRLPDIYFIVLDAYGRKDVLQDTFGLDNSKFLAELQDLGFYVVECSQSNYARTRLSIASTLNMDYVQNLLPEEGQRELNAQLRPYMSDNATRLLLEEIGYKTVEFENGFPWLKWKNVSHYLQKGEKTSIQLQLATGMNPFEELFLNTTLVRAAVDLGLSGAAVSSAPSHRETVLYALETLPKIPRISEPKFVYAHLILPHPPFIFGPNGEEVDLASREVEINDLAFYADEKMRIAFRDQTIYTNKLIIPILRSIIEESQVPPIIVLESDHGPTGYGGPKNRMGNLMAYYLPGKDAAELAYPTITPVNSFRLVFNTYFGGSFPLLEDTSYFSEQTNDANYEVIPNTCGGS